jgi:hypothetical protein
MSHGLSRIRKKIQDAGFKMKTLSIDIHKKNFNHEFHEQDELHKFF